MDPKTLHTNIMNHQRIGTVKAILSVPANKLIATRAKIKFLYFILMFNDFLFNGFSYPEIKSCAMGTTHTPS